MTNIIALTASYDRSAVIGTVYFGNRESSSVLFFILWFVVTNYLEKDSTQLFRWLF